MRVLVTGGAGFIGSFVVERLLAEGHYVDVVDDLSTGSLRNLAQARSATGHFSFQKMDVRVPELIEYVALRRPEVIVHLAGQPSIVDSVARPIFDADNNLIGSLRVFEAALGSRCNKVVVAASGVALYGEGSDAVLPFTEARTPAPATPAGVAAAAVISYLRVYRELFGLDFTVLALANVYGPRQRRTTESGAVVQFADALLQGRVPTVYGDGRQTRDFLFVDDAVDAFIRAIDRGSGAVYNIGTGVETSIRELYLEVARACERSVRPERQPQRAGEVRRSALANDLARRELGWSPWTGLKEGVTTTIAEMASR